MTPTTTSVIIVSRGRPTALTRCLTGVGQLLHSNYEIVVVSDPGGLAALDRAGWTGRVKTIAFDEPNISAARNLGLEQAAGQIVAFIDDDSVPEPTWLTALTAPFADPAVSAAGGFVRGRNGISFQWKARDVRADGSNAPLAVDEDRVMVVPGRAGLGTKTEGTNMAFRRAAIAALGGFDPAFRFYLDETDLNLRLAATGASTAIVPMAQVHHGFASSERRRADRVPRSLFEEAASRAVFLRKHAPDLLQGRRVVEAGDQRRRLLRHMVAGRLEPRDVASILDSFDAGWVAGLERHIVPQTSMPLASVPFLPFDLAAQHRDHVFLVARSHRRKALIIRAASLVAEGRIVTAMLLSPTIRYHQVSFDPRGFWLQQGGLFGRSDRRKPLFQFWNFHARSQLEVERVSPARTKPTEIVTVI